VTHKLSLQPGLCGDNLFTSDRRPQRSHCSQSLTTNIVTQETPLSLTNRATHLCNIFSQLSVLWPSSRITITIFLTVL